MMKQQSLRLIYSLCAVLVLGLTACEGDHVVVETDWTTLETVELQHQYNKYMNGDWEYVDEDSVSQIEMRYSFNTKDSTFTGYYCERMFTTISTDSVPAWHLLWQGNVSGRWVLLHSVDYDQDYIYMSDVTRTNVQGLLANYDLLRGRVLFYGASRSTLRVTTPITLKLIDMHHPVK